MSVLVGEDSMAELISACRELPEIVLPEDVLAHGAWRPRPFVLDTVVDDEWTDTVAAIALASELPGARWATPIR